MTIISRAVGVHALACRILDELQQRATAIVTLESELLRRGIARGTLKRELQRRATAIGTPESEL